LWAWWTQIGDHQRAASMVADLERYGWRALQPVRCRIRVQEYPRVLSQPRHAQRHPRRRRRDFRVRARSLSISPARKSGSTTAPLRLELVDLETFAAVAMLGSFSGAAR